MQSPELCFLGRLYPLNCSRVYNYGETAEPWLAHMLNNGVDCLPAVATFQCSDYT